MVENYFANALVILHAHSSVHLFQMFMTLLERSFPFVFPPFLVKYTFIPSTKEKNISECLFLSPQISLLYHPHLLLHFYFFLFTLVSYIIVYLI